MGDSQPPADWGQLPWGNCVGARLVWRKRKRGMGRHSGGRVLKTDSTRSQFRIARNLEWLVSTGTWLAFATTQSHQPPPPPPQLPSSHHPETFASWGIAKPDMFLFLLFSFCHFCLGLLTRRGPHLSCPLLRCPQDLIWSCRTGSIWGMNE